jgi:hypothetical protein
MIRESQYPYELKVNFHILTKIRFCLHSFADFESGPLPGSFTVSDIVDRAGPPNEAVRDLWMSRARYWAAHGILPTVGRTHRGTGRHRRFDEETAFLAAVLFRLSPRPIAAISAIAHAIRRNLNDPTESRFKAAWAAAKRGEDQHLALAHTDPEVEGGGPVALEIEPVGEKIGIQKIERPIEVSIVNLGAIFRAMQREEV